MAKSKQLCPRRGGFEMSYYKKDKEGEGNRFELAFFGSPARGREPCGGRPRVSFYRATGSQEKAHWQERIVMVKRACQFHPAA